MTAREACAWLRWVWVERTGCLPHGHLYPSLLYTVCATCLIPYALRKHPMKRPHLSIDDQVATLTKNYVNPSLAFSASCCHVLSNGTGSSPSFRGRHSCAPSHCKAYYYPLVTVGFPLWALGTHGTILQGMPDNVTGLLEIRCQEEPIVREGP